MSIYFKQSKNFMTENNIKFIEKTVLNDNFPYFFNSNTLTNKDDAFFSHQVLQRLELSPNYTPVNSEAFAPTIDILNNFVNSISEKVNFYTHFFLAECMYLHDTQEFPNHADLPKKGLDSSSPYFNGPMESESPHLVTILVAIFVPLSKYVWGWGD